MCQIQTENKVWGQYILSETGYLHLYKQKNYQVNECVVA